MLGITYSAEHKIKQERIHLRQPKFGSNTHYPVDIYNIIDAVNPSSILDYGCGKGIAGRTLANEKQIAVNLYDPFVSEYNAKPKPADLVICWNVLNNVEEQFMSTVADHLFNLAHKDLIVKLPLNLHGARYYLNYFKMFKIKQITKANHSINTYIGGELKQEPIDILTVWFTKS